MDNFGAKFAQKSYFLSKEERVNITIQFVKELNFISNC